MQHTLKNLLGGFSGAVTADVFDKNTGKHVAAFEMVNGYKNNFRIMYVTPQDETAFIEAAEDSGLTVEEYVDALVRCSLNEPVGV